MRLLYDVRMSGVKFTSAVKEKKIIIFNVNVGIYYILLYNYYNVVVVVVVVAYYIPWI